MGGEGGKHCKVTTIFEIFGRLRVILPFLDPIGSTDA